MGAVAGCKPLSPDSGCTGAPYGPVFPTCVPGLTLLGLADAILSFYPKVHPTLAMLSARAIAMLVSSVQAPGARPGDRRHSSRSPRERCPVT